MVSVMRSIPDLDHPDVDLDLQLSDADDVEDAASKARTSEMGIEFSLGPSTEEIISNTGTDAKGTDEKNEEPEEEDKLLSKEQDGDAEKERKEDVVEEAEVKSACKESGDEEPKDTAEHEESDLLLVMEEKSTEIDDTEFNKSVIDEEQAPSSSPTDELDKDTTHDMSASQDDITCNDEMMDIGDNIVEVGETTSSNVDARTETDGPEVQTEDADEPEQIISTPDISSMHVLPPDTELEVLSGEGDADLESNKENESRGNKMEARMTRDSSRKRQSDVRDVEEELVKKLRMDETFSIGAVMRDRNLKGFTRKKLEVFVLQKICEALVYKTQVADLRKAVLDKEVMVDALRKEVVALSKQAKDMHLVNEKLIIDLNRFKATPEKPLLVPRITRSVGLQAIARDVIKREPPMRVAPADNSPLPSLTTIVNHNHRSPSRRLAPLLKPKSATITELSKPVTVMPKMSLPKQGASLTPIKPPPVKAESRGGVIDLTSDDRIDEQKAPPGHKIVIVGGQGVLVKMGAPGNQQMSSNATMSTVATVRPVQTSVLKSANTPHPPKILPKPTSMQMAPVILQRNTIPVRRSIVVKKKHPAPFPSSPQVKLVRNSTKPPPPRPELKLSKSKCGTGIVLSWKMPYRLEKFEDIASYQLFAYQETKAEPSTENWGKIGDVKALPLPMAVTLTQFAIGNRYYFAVRAVDVLTRIGEFSDYQTISL